MSTSPTDLPGESIAVMALNKAPLPSAYALTRDNGNAVEALLDRTGLPAPTLVPQPDAVLAVRVCPHELHGASSPGRSRP